MPSPAELQSIATLEAMASGQPIVAVNAGALRELCISDVNGYLCDQDNAEQMAEAIKKILSSKKRRADFSAASLAMAQEHDLEYTLDRFEEIYANVMHR